MSTDKKFYLPGRAVMERVKINGVIAVGFIPVFNTEEDMCDAGLSGPFTTIVPAECVKTFTCKQCGHLLPVDMSMRTEGYCYLCDPNVTVKELLEIPEFMT